MADFPEAGEFATLMDLSSPVDFLGLVVVVVPLKAVNSVYQAQ